MVAACPGSAGVVALYVTLNTNTTAMCSKNSLPVARVPLEQASANSIGEFLKITQDPPKVFASDNEPHFNGIASELNLNFSVKFLAVAKFGR